MGFYNHHKTSESESAGLVPCSDICGTIVAVGPGSSAWKIGDKCLSIFNQTHLKGQVAAAHMTSGLGLPLPGVLCEKGGTVLIQGMGGVAVMGLLIAKASGAKGE
jgi:D-arabinose 1-dehydrogenase-like Zn-dependent alcohol dehydrogenase